MLKNFQEVKEALKKATLQTVAVSVAEDSEVLLALYDAVKEGFIEAILVGNEKEITRLMTEHQIPMKGFQILHEEDEMKAALKCCALIREKKASIIMKGLLDTSKYLKAILNKEQGLSTGRLLSHVALFELKHYPKLLAVTDAAINVTPDVEQKAELIQNAVDIMHSLGIEKPKVACCAAVEKVKSSMPATTDAAILAKMNDRGQIKGCIVDGPFGLDNAVSLESAKIKKIESPVAGQADIILCHDLQSGNYLYKALSFLTESKVGAIVAGAGAPIVLTSRADSHENKYLSLLLAILHSLK